MDYKTPTAENLRSLPYSELKKLAKSKGIKSNMKAEKLIAALTSAVSDDDSFSTPMAKDLNSCKKNKEAKFNQDKMTPLVTPRRGTYSLETPVSVKIEDIPEIKVEKALDFNDSNVTVDRGSERKLRSRKVSFLSPVVTPQTPKNSSLRLRPKTPVASATSLAEQVSPPVTPIRKDPNQVETPKQLFESKEKVNDEVLPETDETPKQMKLSTPGITKAIGTLVDSSRKMVESAVTRSARSMGFAGDSAAKKKLLATPNAAPLSAAASNKRKMSTPGLIKATGNSVNSSKKIINTITPRSTKSTANSAATEDSAAKRKRLTTPNFKKIHEKAFEKMESIDEYHKRKEESAKKLKRPPSKLIKEKPKISTFSGISFVPSVRSSLKSKLNISTSKFDTAKNKTKAEPNTVVKKKTFDLKASLSRKLGYKPYTGALKPLAESNKLNTSQSCLHKAKEAENSVIKEKRLQNRNALKGVRTNKRFELQMKNRQLV